MIDNKDSLDGLYNTLYNSLGVESGLLNRTDIGKNLNQKYREDNFDAKVYALKCIYNIENEIGNSITNDTLYTKNDSSSSYDIIDRAPDIDGTLSEFIRMKVVDDNLTTEEVINEISKYLEEYASNYYIKKILKCGETKM